MSKTLLMLAMATAMVASAADNTLPPPPPKKVKSANNAQPQPVAVTAPVPAQTATATASWIDSITVAPVGAIKTEHLDGPSQIGAGIDIGYNVNPFVAIRVLNLGFEGNGKCQDPWQGAAVDETDLQVDAKISRFSNETFSLHLVAGGQTDWNDNDYGINAGLRLELALGKKLSTGVGYSIRTWFKSDTRVDSLATAQINYRF